MPQWIDVTGPAHWQPGHAALAATPYYGAEVPPGGCVSPSQFIGAIDTSYDGDPESTSIPGLLFTPQFTEGNRYSWDSAKWVPDVYYPDGTDEVEIYFGSDYCPRCTEVPPPEDPEDCITKPAAASFPFLRYIGTSVSAIEKVRITLRARDAFTPSDTGYCDNTVVAPRGVYADIYCAGPLLYRYTGDQLPNTLHPAGSTFVVETEATTYGSGDVTHCVHGSIGGVPQDASSYVHWQVLEITKIELYGEFVGAGLLPPVLGFASNESSIGAGVLPPIEGVAAGTGESDLVTLSETILAAADVRDRAIWCLADTLAIGAAPSSVLEAINRLQDGANLTDGLHAVWRMLLEDGVALGDIAVPSIALAAQLVDGLRLVAGAGSSLECRNAVAAALALGDVLYRVAQEQLADQAGFNAALASALTARMRLLDEAALAGHAGATATITAVVEDTIDAVATPATVLEAINRLHDHIGATLTFRLGDAVYFAWVCSTQNRAFTQYENYPFNSFCELGGRYYGAAPDGIYELVGETDEGEDINARLRLGLSNLGTGKLKRMPAAYLGYSSDGTLALGVVITSPTGEKEQFWYSLQPRPAGATREARIKLGRGLKSVYWDFELTNVEGAHFALDQFELFPLILDRRITGGEG